MNPVDKIIVDIVEQQTVTRLFVSTFSLAPFKCNNVFDNTFSGEWTNTLCRGIRFFPFFFAK